MDKGRKLMIEELALNDAQELLNILKNTPVIEQPELSIKFVKELSMKLRSQKWIEIERSKKAFNEMVLANKKSNN